MKPYLNTRSKLRETLVSENKNFLQDKLFLEFGVHNGGSFLEFYELYKKNNINRSFFGFDSFVGLPEETEDLNSPWQVGNFSCGGRINPELLNKDDITIVDGWYSDTLVNNSYLLEKLSNKKIGIVHIDCDIYSSTMQVYEFMIQNDLLCEGSIIIYDDWGSYLMKNLNKFENGESKAHIDIQKKYNIKFELVSETILDPKLYVVAVYKYIGK